MYTEFPKTLAYVFKVTERCNLACTYCYFFFGGDDSYKVHPPLVLPQTVDGLIAFTLDAVNRYGIQTVAIGFHGGEPLLLKKAPFRALCERLVRELGPHCRLNLNVQTNGVLIDSEWVDLFAEFGMLVGVSFDGPPEAHDRTRVTKKGLGTYAQARRGWDLLLDARASGRIPEPGILCVVDPDQPGTAAFAHFVHEMGARSMDFLLPDITHDAPDANEAFVRRCGDYLIDVCRSWFAAADSGLSVRFIDQTIRPLLSDDLARNAVTRNDPRTLFTVSSNGELAPDDALRPIAPRFREAGLTVGADTMEAVLRHPVWQELMESQTRLPEQCRSCTWQNVCGGGLRQHRYSHERGFDNPSLYCATLKRIYSYVTLQLVMGGIPLNEIERRLQGIRPEVEATQGFQAAIAPV